RWRLGELDIALFAQFARQRLGQRLARLDPAAGQMPATDVTVLDQENAARAVDHQRAHAQRHAAREAPVEPQHAPQRQFERTAYAFEAAPFHPALVRLRYRRSDGDRLRLVKSLDLPFRTIPI